MAGRVAGGDLPEGILRGYPGVMPGPDSEYTKVPGGKSTSLLKGEAWRTEGFLPRLRAGAGGISTTVSTGSKGSMSCSAAVGLADCPSFLAARVAFALAVRRWIERDRRQWLNAIRADS